MGDNVLSSAVSGETIPAADHNSLVTALVEEHVPRDANKTPGDLAGSLGTSIYRWFRAFVSELRIGAAVNNNYINERAAQEVAINVNDTEVAAFTETSFDCADDYIPKLKVAGFIFNDYKKIAFNTAGATNITVHTVTANCWIWADCQSTTVSPGTEAQLYVSRAGTSNNELSGIGANYPSPYGLIVRGGFYQRAFAGDTVWYEGPTVDHLHGFIYILEFPATPE